MFVHECSYNKNVFFVCNEHDYVYISISHYKCACMLVCMYVYISVVLTIKPLLVRHFDLTKL